MKAKELRIGNWVFGVSYKKNIQFGAEHFTDYVGHVRGAYRPIPLTEEWLERFGFKYEGEFDFERSNIGIEKINGHWTVWTCGTIESFWSDIRYNIEYVHQLQNLYFALTGEELEIKEKVK